MLRSSLTPPPALPPRRVSSSHPTMSSGTHLLKFFFALLRFCVRSCMGAIMECNSDSCAAVELAMAVTSSVARCDRSSRCRSFLMRRESIAEADVAAFALRCGISCLLNSSSLSALKIWVEV
jgi:hypothetical protein